VQQRRPPAKLIKAVTKKSSNQDLCSSLYLLMCGQVFHQKFILRSFCCTTRCELLNEKRGKTLYFPGYLSQRGRLLITVSLFISIGLRVCIKINGNSAIIPHSLA